MSLKSEQMDVEQCSAQETAMAKARGRERANAAETRLQGSTAAVPKTVVSRPGVRWLMLIGIVGVSHDAADPFQHSNNRRFVAR